MSYCKKEDKNRIRKGILLVVLTLAALGAFLTTDRYKQSEYLAFASSLGLTEAECRCCHDTGVPDTHHLLVESDNYVCLDCHEFIYDENSGSTVPVIIRDCLVCHVGSLSNRHHIANQDCFACHEAVWDPDTQSYFMTFVNGCAPTTPLENCSDGIDNDSNGQIDCNDPYCAGTTDCLPTTAEICTDGIDNNGNGLIDCDDLDCINSQFCLPPEPEDCNDALDNDHNGLIDCDDPACSADPLCVIPSVEICDDTIDNDGDQWVDCNDSDCYGDTYCIITSVEICTDGIDNDSNGLIDCEDPDCTGSVDCPDPNPTPTSHFELHQSPSSDCTACHLTNLQDQHSDNCNYCHQNPNIEIQQAVAAGLTSCTACHLATTHTMGCANCHRNWNSNTDLDRLHQGHMLSTECGVCHAIPETISLEPTGQHCIICHGIARPYTSAQVPDLHRVHVTSRGSVPFSCNMCHGQNIPQIRPEECSACHPDNRQYGPADLPTIHTTHSNLFDCTNCHFDPRLFALDDQATSCLRCHEMRPYNTTLEVHSLHTGQSCWACHTSNGITARAGHNCASCHDGTTPTYRRLDTDVHERHTLAGAPCWTCHSQLVPVFPTLQLSTASPSGSISGTVTDSQGAPVEHVNVYMQDCGHSTLTAADGSYTLNYISPGNYTLNADKAGFQPAFQQVTVSVGYTSTVDFNLTPLQNTGTVSGVVLDGLGQPAIGAKVMSADMQYSATVGADGSYVLGPIVESIYQLTAVLYGYVDQTKTVAVTTGQTSTADFTLVQIGPEDCFDGFDNDDDGQIDCADNDCGPECNSLEEICGDGVDNDLDGLTDCFDQDCNSECNSCTDIDGDGYYIDGGVCGVLDCNDADPGIHPGVVETCDGIDNNCAGGVDEGLTTRYYLDSDGDGFGKPTVYVDACSQPAGYVLDNTDCNDSSGAAYPGGTEVCDGLDNNCDSFVDEGLTSTFYLDGDSDGYGSAASDIEACSQPAGYVADSNDCNDNNALVHPAMTETCNGVDDNCDTQIDEGVTSTFYLDSDGDTFGDSGSTTQACIQPAGYVLDNTDCNDSSGAAYPGGTEVCDGLDNNCDSFVDEGLTSTFYLDDDSDGYGSAASDIEACSQPAGYVADSNDCNDNNALVHPAMTETCNGVDDNCDTQIDEGVTSTFYLDSDGDTFGDSGSTTQACIQPAGYVLDNTDCNDSSGAAYPGGTEVCDGLDNDCNGSVDDGLLVTYFRDFDSDGFGDPDRTRESCDGPDNGYILDNTDCDDQDSAINPATAEIPDDGIDNNCNGEVDEGSIQQEICDDGIDNDGDGMVDCHDNHCNTDPACGSQQEICNDGIDNDGNNKADCDDNQCRNDPYCQTSMNCRDITEEEDCEDSGCYWNDGKDRCESP